MRRVYEVINDWHFTDRLNKWNLHRTSREESWCYHHQIVFDTPTPENFIRVRFEDFVENHKEQVDRLSDFLGCDLECIDVDPSKSRYIEEYPLNDETKQIMKKLGYEVYE